MRSALGNRDALAPVKQLATFTRLASLEVLEAMGMRHPQATAMIDPTVTSISAASRGWAREDGASGGDRPRSHRLASLCRAGEVEVLEALGASLCQS